MTEERVDERITQPEGNSVDFTTDTNTKSNSPVDTSDQQAHELVSSSFQDDEQMEKAVEEMPPENQTQTDNNNVVEKPPETKKENEEEITNENPDDTANEKQEESEATKSNERTSFAESENPVVVESQATQEETSQQENASLSDQEKEKLPEPVGEKPSESESLENLLKSVENPAEQENTTVTDGNKTTEMEEVLPEAAKALETEVGEPSGAVVDKQSTPEFQLEDNDSKTGETEVEQFSDPEKTKEQEKPTEAEGESSIKYEIPTSAECEVQDATTEETQKSVCELETILQVDGQKPAEAEFAEVEQIETGRSEVELVDAPASVFENENAQQQEQPKSDTNATMNENVETDSIKEEEKSSEHHEEGTQNTDNSIGEKQEEPSNAETVLEDIINENKLLKSEIESLKAQQDINMAKLEKAEQELSSAKSSKEYQDVPFNGMGTELHEKLAETQRDLDSAERKVKDLQLRLKRFVKDDQLKDEKIAQIEREKRELAESFNKLEQLLAETRHEGQNNNTSNGKTNKSSVCVIL